jgi:hypothetical protein
MGWASKICLWDLKGTKRTITLHSLKIMESFDNRFTSQVDFNNSDVCIEFCRQMIKVIIIHCLCGGGMIIGKQYFAL